MTTSIDAASARPPAWNPIASLRRGISALLRPEETWVAFLLMTVLFLTVVWTVEGAKWVREMPGLSGMALGALLAGYVLARLRVPAILLHPVGLFIGLLVIVWQTAASASGSTFADKVVDAGVRLLFFKEVLESGGISIDGLPFVIQVLVLTWLLGYFSAWFLYRSHNVWLAMVPPGVALMVNLTYLPGRFTFNFVLFVIASLLLVMLMNGVEQHRRWRRDNVPPEELVHLSYVGPVLAFGTAVLMLSFWMPLAEQSSPLTRVWEVATGPWREFEREFDRLFASVSSGRVTPLHSFGRAMPFRGAVNFGDQLPLQRLGLARDSVMYIQADEPGYWRAESYDSYTGQGWIATERVSKPLPQDPVQGVTEEFKDRRLATQTIELATPMDVLFSRGLPIFGNVQANGETGQPASYVLNLVSPSENRGLNPRLRELADRLSRELRTGSGGRLLSQGEIQRALPPDLRVKQARQAGTAGVTVLEVVRTEPFPPDYSSVRSPTTLPRGQKYSITSLVSVASAEALQNASGDYPGWVTDQYLRLPPNVTQRTRQLAREWAADAGNVYDVAANIESRLREFPYSTNVAAPPRGSDGVDYFLFDQKRGYADYHAAGMAVMLRTMGIPARVSVGYVGAEWDTEKEHYVVREAHAHAWPEVFFPGYGWIEFNPTPNWPPLTRSGLGAGGGVSGEEDFIDADAPLLEDDELLNPATASGTQADQAIEYGPVLWNTTVVLAFLGAAFLVLRLIWLRGLAGLALPARTYEQMCRLASLARLGPRPQQTPEEYARVLTRALPEGRPSIEEITRDYSRVQYGRRQLGADDAQRLQASWNFLRWRLLLKALRWRGAARR